VLEKDRDKNIKGASVSGAAAEGGIRAFRLTDRAEKK
jgi:hypothetical protein